MGKGINLSPKKIVSYLLRQLFCERGIEQAAQQAEFINK